MRFPALLFVCSIFLTSGCAWLGSGDDKDSNKTDTSGYTEADFFEKIQKKIPESPHRYNMRPNHNKNLRNERFRNRRVGFKKIASKNIDFS